MKASELVSTVTNQDKVQQPLRQCRGGGVTACLSAARLAAAARPALS